MFGNQSSDVLTGFKVFKFKTKITSLGNYTSLIQESAFPNTKTKTHIQG